jgi:hypothetical protein
MRYLVQLQGVWRVQQLGVLLLARHWRAVVSHALSEEEGELVVAALGWWAAFWSFVVSKDTGFYG